MAFDHNCLTHRAKKKKKPFLSKRQDFCVYNRMPRFQEFAVLYFPAKRHAGGE